MSINKDQEMMLRALFGALAYIASLPEGRADELNKLLEKCGEWEPSFELPDLDLPDKTGDYLAYVKYTSPSGEYDGEGWEVLAYSELQKKFMIADSTTEHIEILIWSELPDYNPEAKGGGDGV